MGQHNGGIGLSRPYLVGHEQVPVPVQAVGYHVQLVGPQPDILR